jgi:molybdate transport system regulatory protein
VQVKVKLSLADSRGAPFMGVGLAWLLRRIESMGSIQTAAQDMGLSYAKAHRILKGLEAATNRTFLVRRKGGNDRGGARLTPYALRFVDRYERLSRRVEAFASRAFARDFAGKKGD